MPPLIIAATPLTYAEYRKLSLVDFSTRYPYYYILLPGFSALLFIILLFVVADTGFSAMQWREISSLILPLVVVVIIWGATWYSLQRSYDRSETLKNGTPYRLDEQGIALEDSSPVIILWSNIARTAVQSGQWIILRQASFASKEMYFLNTNGVLSPADRADLLALLKQKRIKRI